ncbi:hypothetical protein EC957_003945 [Mortierella hygrophila]|uniref:BTB domain-containing protein n=1 Tax=Mortierella hygrophila TaxID=979708 RepID=A0A9P6F171_9FUNG|nr:hypothetical protein EC957_003945 [Mortierella hygrophila]
MTPTATVTRRQEVTLRVEAPQLNDTTTSTTKTAVLEGNSFWTVSLTRSHASLNVSAVWNRQQHGDVTNYTMMHIIPHSKNSSILEKTNSGTALMQGSPAQCVIDIDKVVDDGMYRFDIVFSTHKEIARKLVLPPLKSREILPLLLKDPNTVDVCFTFSSDKAHSHIGLWAHRVVLSRYKVFAKLIEKEDAHQRLMSKANGDEDKDKVTTTIKAEPDVEPNRTISDDTPSAAPSIDSCAIMIKVDKFPLATFCALLYYIYMDEIDLSVDTGRFVVSVSEGGSLVWRDSDGKIREHHPSTCWPPLDQGSPWKLKDVAWDELLEAADFYDVSELRSHCLTGALNGLNEQNAVRFVFSCDADVKRMAMRYIVDRAEEFFEKGKQDPFLAYKEHPDCHEVLVELMQMKAKKA